MNAQAEYRTDIDGLRAVAVLGVVIYHYSPLWLPGGFTGVDVFFVISGYLITGILRRGIEAGSFSLVGFYARRMRRILPALLAMLAATLVAGWLVLMPGDYADLGKSASYAAIGAANFYFLAHTGYFDQAADLQPLLHTWSLGVEEQFYLVWPALLLAGLAVLRSRRLFLTALAAVTVLSFAYAQHSTHADPVAAFYLPHLRCWELAAGAIVVFLPRVTNRFIAQSLASVGAMLLSGSFLLVSAQTPFPAVGALPACIGAASVIWAGQATLVARALSLRPLRAVGRVSYSLYLWHWPVLVFFKHYASTEVVGIGAAVPLLAVTAVLSWVSWRFIEEPFRRGRVVARWRPVVTGAAAMILVGAAGLAILTASGFPSRLPESALAVQSLEVQDRWDCPRQVSLPHGGPSFCSFGAEWQTAEQRIMLWGDSHARHFAPLLEAALAGTNASAILFLGCAPAYGGSVHRLDPNVERSEAACAESYADAVTLLDHEGSITSVILAASWAGKFRSLYRTGRADERSTELGQELLYQALMELTVEAAATGRRFLILDTIPPFSRRGVACTVSRHLPLLRQPCGSEELRIRTTDFLAGYERVLGVFERVAQASPDVDILVPRRALCDEYCRTELNGEFIYRDHNHLRRNLSESTKAEFARMIGLTDWVRQRAAIAPLR